MRGASVVVRNRKFPPCPACQRKGLRYADHPHAFGWRDYSRAYCRFCHQRFPVAERTVQP